MTNTARMHVPTLAERFWRKMGFHYHLGDEPEGTEKMTGWMQTTARFDFSVLDRLRLLMTGRLKVVLSIHTDGKVDNAISRVDYEIKYPGDR
jgi:hypothetical protein